MMWIPGLLTNVIQDNPADLCFIWVGSGTAATSPSKSTLHCDWEQENCISSKQGHESYLSRRDHSFRSPFIERGDRGGDRFISSPEGLPRGGEKEPHPPCTSHTPRAQVITPLCTQWQQHTDCPSPTPLFTLSPSCPPSPTSPSSTAPKHHLTSLHSTAASNPPSTFGGDWYIIEP